MKREDLLIKIRHEASSLESPPLFAPLRAEDLLKYDGEEFIDTLYRTVLKREPDAAGKAHYLNIMRTVHKPLILYMLSKSEEARQKQTRVVGVYSALMSFYLKTPSALMRVSSAVMKKAVLRVNPLHSLRKPAEESKTDYSGFEGEYKESEQETEQGSGIYLSSLLKAAEESKVDYFKFYSDFEGEFRGSEQDTEQGLKVYLPLLQVANASIFDLGSGRGEWLRLLKKEGFSAKGVDINPYFVEKCEAESLDVVKRDVFQFLRNAGSSSIGVITAFHLIEHLDPRQRLLFLREIYRVLETGGILILETPNPRNILVSAGDFWRDAEHTAPVFPDTLSLMARFAGFSEVECYFFKEDRTALVPYLDVHFRDLKDYIEVSRDFALSARKS